MDCPINWPTEVNYSNLYKNLDVDDEIKLEYYQSLYLPNVCNIQHDSMLF